MSTVIEEFVARLGWEVDATQLRTFERQLTGLKSSLRTAFRVATVGAAAATAGIYKVMGAFSMVEDAEAAFTPLMGSVNKAKQLVEELNKTAATTPFQFEQIAGTANLLLPIMNKNIGNTVDTFRMLGDTAGGNVQKLESIVRGYTKTMMRGKVSMEDLNILMEGGKLPILDEIAKTLGKPTEKLFDMISAGKVSAEDLTNTFKRMTSAGGLYYKGMDIASKTLTGRISTLKDNVAMAAAELGKSFAPAIKRSVDRLIEFVPRIKEWFVANRRMIEQGFDDFITNLAEGVKTLVSYAKKLKDMIDAVGGLGKAAKIAGVAFAAIKLAPILASMEKIIKSAPTLKEALKSPAAAGAVSWGKWGSIIGLALVALGDLDSQLSGMPSALNRYVGNPVLRLIGVFDGLTVAQQKAVKMMTADWMGSRGFVGTISYGLTVIWETLVDWKDRISDLLSNWWNDQYNFYIKPMVDTLSAIGNMFSGSKERVGSLREGLRDRVKGPRAAPKENRAKLAVDALNAMNAQESVARSTQAATSGAGTYGASVGTMNVTVNAVTNASASNIAKTVSREIDKKFNYFNRNAVSE